MFGGGGSGGGAMLVEFTFEGQNLNSNKTVEEVVDAMIAGQVVTGVVIAEQVVQPLGTASIDMFIGGVGFAPWVDEGTLKYTVLGSYDTFEWEWQLQ